MKKKREFSAAFKAKIAIEVIKERKTVHELNAKYEVHPTQINTKQEFFDNAESVFSKDHAEPKTNSKRRGCIRKSGNCRYRLIF